MAVMAAGDRVVAQGALAHLRHVPVADVNGTGQRRVCFSQQEATLHVLVAEAIDREREARANIVGAEIDEAIAKFLPDADADSRSAMRSLASRGVFIEAYDSGGWGWSSVEIQSGGCYDVSASNARARLYSLRVSRR